MSSSVPRKGYPLNQSPLCYIRGKGQFKDVIGVEWDAVPELLAADSYRVWLNSGVGGSFGRFASS